MSIYYESSWAILSTIGIGNVLFGWIITGIAGLSASSLIPIVTSAAGAIANGLCYHVYYEDPAPAPASATGASVVADVMWLIQEAGISFYSYIILEHILTGRTRVIFRTLFWSFMVVIAVARILILTMRLRGLIDSNFNGQTIINGLHMGYFVSIAAVECVSAYFLLRKFMSAKQLSSQAELGTRLFKHLMRSTEIRLATLALIGVTRAITYFFQSDPQQATSTASQLDRFVYTLECLFPIMLYIDILASKITYSRHAQDVSLPRISNRSRTDGTPKSDELLSAPSVPHSSWYEEIDGESDEREREQHHKQLAQDRIVAVQQPRGHSEATSRYEPHDVTKPPVARGHGIVRTVEVTVE